MTDVARPGDEGIGAWNALPLVLTQSRDDVVRIRKTASQQDGVLEGLTRTLAEERRRRMCRVAGQVTRPLPHAFNTGRS